jgi:erythromycin esterase-like protein
MMQMSLIRSAVATAIAVMALSATFVVPAAGQSSPRSLLETPPVDQPPAIARPAPARIPRTDQLVDYGIYRLKGADASLPQDDLTPLRQILEGAQVVGLGESIHTSGGYYKMKHRLFRYLVEEMGFRAFAMETPWPQAEITAQYVDTCQGTVEEAMWRIFGVWGSTETGELLTYMCSWNRTHPDDKITFFGFDVQQPHRDGPALIAFLLEHGVPATDPRVQGVFRCDGVVAYADLISDADNDVCLGALNQIDALLAELDPSEELQRERANLEWLKIRSIGLRSWQVSTYYYYRDQFVTSTNVRDAAMAQVFLRSRTLRVGAAKTAIWAANSHISKGVWWTNHERMGEWLTRALGGRYAAVGLVSAHPSIDWIGVGCGERLAYDYSIERFLEQLDEPYLLVDLDFNGTNRTFAPFLDANEPIMIGAWAHVPRRDFDALVYLHTSPPMTPIWWPPCIPQDPVD